jgi:hypothetical protein
MRVNIALWHGSSQKPLIPSCDATSAKVSSQRLAMIQNLDVILFSTLQHLSCIAVWEVAVFCVGSCNICQKLSSVCRMFYVEHLLFGVKSLLLQTEIFH